MGGLVCQRVSARLEYGVSDLMTEKVICLIKEKMNNPKENWEWR